MIRARLLPSTEMKQGTWLLFLLGILLAGMLLRGAYLFKAKESPFFKSPIIDAREYFEAAQAMAAGDWLLKEEKIYHHGHLYPLFLALLSWITSNDFFSMKLVQMVLGALSCTLLAALSAPILGRRTSILAGFMAATYGTLIIYEGEFLAEPLLLTASLLLALCLLRLVRDPSFPRAALCGVLIGVCGWIKSSALIVIPFLLPCLCLWFRIPARERPSSSRAPLRVWLWVLLLTLLTLAPVTLRNWLVGKDLVLTQANMGLNFFIGNNPDADGTPNVRPGWEWVRLREMALKEGFIKPSEQNAFYLKRSLRFLRESPLQYARLLFKKAHLFFHGYELGVSVDLEHCRETAPLLKLLPFTFGLISPLALLGLVLHRRQLPRFLLPILFVLSYLCAGVLFEVCARYRLPAVPFLVMLASSSIQWGYLRARSREWGRLVKGFALFALLWALLNIPHGGTRPPNSHWMLGIAYKNRGLLEEARREFEALQREDPGNIEGDLKIAEILIEREEYAKALEITRRAMERDGEFSRSGMAHLNLGFLYAVQGDFEQAEAEYREAIRIIPQNIPAILNLGHLYSRQKLYGKAGEEYRKALDLDPLHPEARNNLGSIYRKTKEYGKAEEELLEALRLKPVLWEAHYNLLLLYLETGQPERALRRLQESQEILRDHGMEKESELLRERFLLSFRGQKK